MVISKVETQIESFESSLQMPDSHSDFKNKIFQIREALGNYFLKEEGKRLEDIEIFNILLRSFSSIIFLNAKTSNGNIKLVAKSVVHHPINISITKKENQAVVEYNLLKFLYPKFQNLEGCSVPRPILVIPEIETYVIEFVKGPLLADEFRFARYFSSKDKFDTLKRCYFNCGRWLRHFQEFTGIHEQGYEALIGVIDRCNYRLKLIEDLNDSRCPKKLRNKVMGFLQEKFEQLKGSRIYVSGRHGDFGSWNILIGPRGITVIDYLGYCEDPIYVDITKMLMNFEDERKYLAYNPLRIKDLRKSFLEGYGPLPPVSESELVICETFHRACSLFASLCNNGGPWYHRIERQICLRANLKWLINEQNRKLLWPTDTIKV